MLGSTAQSIDSNISHSWRKVNCGNNHAGMSSLAAKTFYLSVFTHKTFVLGTSEVDEAPPWFLCR